MPKSKSASRAASSSTSSSKSSSEPTAAAAPRPGGRPTLAFVAPWECSRAIAPIPTEPRDDVIVVLLESVAKGVVAAVAPPEAGAHPLGDAPLRRRAAQRPAISVRLERAPSYAEGIVQLARETGAGRVVATEAREWDMQEELERAEALLGEAGVELVLRPDRGFLASRQEFAEWAEGRKEYRMEWFYREMRRKWNVLMDADGKPEGGQWNYDAENRKPWPKGRAVPAPFHVEPDDDHA